MSDGFELGDPEQYRVSRPRRLSPPDRQDERRRRLVAVAAGASLVMLELAGFLVALSCSDGDSSERAGSPGTTDPAAVEQREDGSPAPDDEPDHLTEDLLEEVPEELSQTASEQLEDPADVGRPRSSAVSGVLTAR